MIQDHRTAPPGPSAGPQSPSRGSAEPVEHLHFDRRTREWRSHPEVTVSVAAHETAGAAEYHGVSA